MVQIANPIYDVVFKYLMNDDKVARLLLSAIIGEEVISLEFRPTEQQLEIGKSLTVLRMDFSAKTISPEGKERLVIIELQKAKLATDIMRFRRYLGKQYANRANVVGYDPKTDEKDNVHRKALPILSIYFLGHPLDHSDAPVIQVKRSYVDAATGEELKGKEEFIESLTHDSVVIQIKKLKGNRRTELERLLMVFDQTNTDEDDHFLNINEEELPERYRPVMRRLQSALADQKVRDTMDAEDDIISELQGYERIIEGLDKTIEKKDKAIEEKDKAIEEKDKAIEEKDKAIEEKESQLHHAIYHFADSGMDAATISNIIQIDVEVVKNILSKR